MYMCVYLVTIITVVMHVGDTHKYLLCFPLQFLTPPSFFVALMSSPSPASAIGSPPSVNLVISTIELPITITILIIAVVLASIQSTICAGLHSTPPPLVSYSPPSSRGRR